MSQVLCRRSRRPCETGPLGAGVDRATELVGGGAEVRSAGSMDRVERPSPGRPQRLGPARWAYLQDRRGQWADRLDERGFVLQGLRRMSLDRSPGHWTRALDHRCYAETTSSVSVNYLDRPRDLPERCETRCLPRCPTPSTRPSIGLRTYRPPAALISHGWRAETRDHRQTLRTDKILHCRLGWFGGG